ncbi:hypothetical protein Tco_1185772 [Tanacetum coccineum]
MRLRVLPFRNAYARALIEVSAEKQLMEEIVITVPYGKEKGHSLATIKLEYDWKPPRCDNLINIDQQKCTECSPRTKGEYGSSNCCAR